MKDTLSLSRGDIVKITNPVSTGFFKDDYVMITQVLHSGIYKAMNEDFESWFIEENNFKTNKDG